MRIQTLSGLPFLTSNCRFLMAEMLRRGIVIDLLSAEKMAYTASVGSHTEYMVDVLPLSAPYNTVTYFSHKQISRQLLQQNSISAVDGQSFLFQEKTAAVSYALKMGFPLVVKPTEGSEGEGVFMDLCDIHALNDALADLTTRLRHYREFMIERQFDGEEFRVFMAVSGQYAVTKREPAFVIGDGTHTIEELAETETWRRMNPRRNCLCEIPLDDVVDRYLEKQGLDILSIPQKDQKIFLRSNSNLKTGGMAIDFTDKIHPTVIEICRKILELTRGLPYVGVDFMSKNITLEQTPETYAIIEVNPITSIGMHLAPGEGTSRPVDRWIVDMIFPETRESSDS